MTLAGKSILDATWKDFADAGFTTLKYIARNGVPYLSTCVEKHKYKPEMEDGILYIQCTKCGEAHVLSSKEKIRRGIAPLTYRDGSPGFGY